MKRSEPLRRTKGLKSISAKRRAPAGDGEPLRRSKDFSQATRAKVRKRSNGACQAKVSTQCRGGVEHFHHVLMRSQGGLGTEDNCLGVCDPCHRWIHANPTEAYELGLLRRGAGVIRRAVVRPSG